MKKVWISGASGFLGKRLVSSLNSLRGEFVITSFSGDIANFDEVKASIQAARPDIIVHLAAMSHPAQCEQNPIEALQVNTLGTLTTLKAAEALGQPIHFIFTSTAQVYQPKDGSPIDEKTTVAPANFYATTKRFAEEILLKSKSEYLRFSILRLFNHIHHSQPPAYFLSSIRAQLLKAKEAGNETPTLKAGNLNLIRDFGSIFDLVRALTATVKLSVHTLAEYKEPQIINIGSGKGKNLEHLAMTLAAKMGLKPKFELDSALLRANDPASLVADISKAQRILNWDSTAKDEESLLKDFLAD